MAHTRSRRAIVGSTVVAVTLSLAAASCGQEADEFLPILAPPAASDPDNPVRMFNARDLAPEQYTRVADVSAISCQPLPFDPPPSERNAVIELQRKAYAAGGDGLLDTQCRSAGPSDWPNTCQTRIECRGTAIKVGGAADGGGSGGAVATFSGTGFVVSRAGHVLTNAHVVRDCRTYAGMVGERQIRLSFVNADTANDLALLTMDAAPAAVATFRTGKAVRAGDSVIAVGFPLQTTLANQMNVTTGTVSATAGVGNDVTRMQITAPIQPGNSGGPLLDSSGHVVGVVVSKLNALNIASQTGSMPENVNFAVKGEIARAYLDSRGVSYQTGSSGKAVATADVGERAKDYTVFIVCQ